MDALDQLVHAIDHADSLLAETVLEPDPDLIDGPGLSARVRLVEKAVDEVVELAGEASASIDDHETVVAIRMRVARMLGRTAALLHLTGDGQGFRRRVDQGSDLALDGELREELEAGRRDVVWFCRLQHARWLREHDQLARADAAFARIAKSADAAGLRAAAKTALDNRPLRSAPALFRLNGFGVGMYGRRDRQADGWYVATHCLSALFVPILPLAAYWVREVDGGYQFRSRARLGVVARVWQLCVLVFALGGVGWYGVSQYLESPSHQARVAMDAARAAEASGNRAAALELFGKVVREHGATGEATDAAEAVVRLASQSVTAPATPESVDAIGRVVSAYLELPEPNRSGAPTRLLLNQLATWAQQIGLATAPQAEASLSVLESARSIGEGTPEQARVMEQAAAARHALADLVAPEQPLYALSLDVRAVGDVGRLRRALATLDGFGESASLWIEAEPTVLEWLQAARLHKALSADAGRIEKALEKARAAHAETTKLIEAADEKQLVKALAASPSNQELAVALAVQQRERGDSKAALATLVAIGPSGRMTATAQQVLAACHSDLGDLAAAEGVLAAFVGQRLPPFQMLQREYDSAVRGFQARVLRDIDRGQVPPDLDSAMQPASEQQRPEIFRSWLIDQIDRDAALAALKAQFERHSAVVPASLALGTIRLRRANEASGEERRALLASAERVFLSIGQAAEGDPSYHLGLGQVYHRLGRPADGDAELRQLLERKEPQLMLQVARVYRELGAYPRARQVAETIHGAPSAKDEERKAAAFMLAHLAVDPDEERAWLEKSDTTLAEVKDQMVEAQAKRDLRDGKYAEADRGFAKVVAFREREAKHNPVSANNAAIALGERYHATGDVTHLRNAAKLLEAAARVAPDNALLLDNVASMSWQVGVIAVLDGFIQTRQMVVIDPDGVVDSLLDGPLRDRVLESLKREPLLRRAREAHAQEQVLSPQKQEAYRHQFAWLGWHEDVKGLEELDKRLAALAPFDAGDTAAERRKFETRSKDEQHVKAGAQWLARAEDSVKRAQKANHGPTLASALLQLGSAQQRQALLTRDDALLDAAIDSYRRAASAWPEAGLTRQLVAPLAIAAVLRTMKTTPALAKVWEKHERQHDTLTIALSVGSGPDGAAVLAALRKRPELLEAVKLAKETTDTRPTPLDWLVAKLAGDVELERAAAKVFDRPGFLISARIDTRLLPGEAREAANLAFLESRGATLLPDAP